MLRGLMLLAALTAPGCKRAPEAAPDVAASAAPVDPLADMHKVLSRRDPEPTCADAAGSRTDPVPDFLTLAQEGGAPAWVPMRAASCVIALDAEGQADALAGWLSNPDQRGLALLLLDELDQLPDALALRLATEALTGPHAEDARIRLQQTTSPALADLRDAPEAP